MTKATLANAEAFLGTIGDLYPNATWEDAQWIAQGHGRDFDEPGQIEDMYTIRQAKSLAIAAWNGSVELPAYMELEDLVLYVESEDPSIMWNDITGEWESYDD